MDSLIYKAAVLWISPSTGPPAIFVQGPSAVQLLLGTGMAQDANDARDGDRKSLDSWWFSDQQTIEGCEMLRIVWRAAE